MEKVSLAARVREGRGKGAARKLRSDNRIPAVFYGPESGNVVLSLAYPDLDRLFRETSSDNVILDLEIESGSGNETKKAIIKDLQIDPIKQSYLHVDFYEISMDKEITVEIPIELVNTPVGVKEDNGILHQIRREITVSCLPRDLVDYLELDVSELNIGDSYHISDLDLPDGLRSEEEEHLAVVTVSAPSVEPEPEEELEEELEEGLEGAEDEKPADEQEAESAE